MRESRRHARSTSSRLKSARARFDRVCRQREQCMVVQLRESAAMASPRASAKTQMATNVLAGRLKQCWALDFDWELIPQTVREVSDACNKPMRELLPFFPTGLSTSRQSN